MERSDSEKEISLQSAGRKRERGQEIFVATWRRCAARKLLGSSKKPSNSDIVGGYRHRRRRGRRGSADGRTNVPFPPPFNSVIVFPREKFRTGDRSIPTPRNRDSILWQLFLGWRITLHRQNKSQIIDSGTHVSCSHVKNCDS